MVLVPEVLNNIRLASNAFKLCGATKRWCRYMAAGVTAGGGDTYGVRCSPGGESQLVTSTA